MEEAQQVAGQGQIRLAATLSPHPKDLHVLWQEYESGIGGRKKGEKRSSSTAGGRLHGIQLSVLSVQDILLRWQSITYTMCTETLQFQNNLKDEAGQPEWGTSSSLWCERTETSATAPTWTATTT